MPSIRSHHVLILIGVSPRSVALTGFGRMHTVGFLIESGTAVRWHCVICEKSGEADLLAIKAARGPDYDLSDRTPWCQSPGCLGRVWFSVRIGSWMRKLLTAEGEARLEAHGDWVFEERHRLKKATSK